MVKAMQYAAGGAVHAGNTEEGIGPLMSTF